MARVIDPLKTDVLQSQFSSKVQTRYTAFQISTELDVSFFSRERGHKVVEPLNHV